MVAWQEADVVANGIRLHYYRSGGHKPPIILTHGITDSGRCWPRVTEALAADYDIIAVDARGHGKSEKPERGYAREEHAKDVAGLIEALELSRPAVMGHSMGAGTASVVAANFPQLVGVLVLEDPPWRPTDTAMAPDEHAATWAEQIRERKTLTPEELLERGRTDNPAWSLAEFEPWVDAKYLVSPDVVGYITEAELSWGGVVEKIQCPTLLVTADPELGAIVTPEVAAEVKKANPRIEVARIEDAGHNIRREQFDAYLEAVTSFLNKHYRSRNGPDWQRS